MELSSYEQKAAEQIQKWKESRFNADTNDLIHIYDRWLEESMALLPDDIKEKFFNQLDQWLFYIYSAVQKSQLQTERIENILSEAKTINSEIEYVEDLKKIPLEYLDFLANKQITNHELLSAVQGGISASGNSLLLGADLPLIAMINLPTVQRIGAAYGFDPSKPAEMMVALKVFYSATLPKRFQQAAWEGLMDEVKDISHPYLYEGDERIIDQAWMTRILSQILKGLLILLFNKRKDKGFSLISILLGAGVNYSITRRVAAFAKHFYQARLLEEKFSS